MANREKFAAAFVLGVCLGGFLTLLGMTNSCRAKHSETGVKAVHGSLLGDGWYGNAPRACFVRLPYKFCVDADLLKLRLKRRFESSSMTAEAYNHLIKTLEATDPMAGLPSEFEFYFLWFFKKALVEVTKPGDDATYFPYHIKIIHHGDVMSVEVEGKEYFSWIIRW